MAVFLGAFGIRVLFAVIALPALDARLGFGYAASNFDADHYGAIADSILQGTYADVQRAPVYPAFIALMYVLFGHSNTAVKVAQALIDTGTVALVWSIGGRMSPGGSARRTAGLLYAAYPLAWWRCGFIDKEVIETFGLALFVYSFRGVGMKWRLGSGLLLGVSNLIKPILLGIPAVVGIWLWTQRKRLSAPAAQFVALIVGVLLLVAPWTLRNYALTGQFVPVALENGGMTAYVGNFVPGLGAWEGPHKADWQTQLANIAAQHPNASQVELDRLYMRAALSEITAQPTRFPEMVALKMWRFWFANPSGRLGGVVLAIQFIVLGLALIGLAQSGIASDARLLLSLVIGYVWLVHALVYAEVRFSLPAAPYLMVFAAVGASVVWARLVEGRLRRPQPALRGATPSASMNVRSQISSTSSGHKRAL